MSLRKLTIFIAGSTHSDWVNENKQAIKLLQIEMRHELEKSYGTTLLCTDCDNPAADNNQEIYNHQIKEEAEVFVLLVDSTPVGPYSMEELIRACVYKEQQRHPKVYVFFAKELKGEPYTTELLNVIRTMTGRYSDFYDDPTEVKKKMAEVIRKTAREKNEEAALQERAEAEARAKQERAEAEARLQQQQAEDAARKEQRHKRLTHWLLGILSTILIVGTGIGSYLFAQQRNATPILFAGGGSVKAFLDSAKVTIANRTDGIYVHMPTGNSWVLLGEEQKIDKNSSDGERKYYPLILAADDIKDNQEDLKIDKPEKFKEKVGFIADLYIGEDPLYVGVPTNASHLAPMLPFIHHLKEGYITGSELADILVHFSGTDTITVYHTSPSSGTISMYTKIMTSSSDKVDENTIWCWNSNSKTGHTDYNSQTTPLSNVTSSPFITLESEYYHIGKPFKAKEIQRLRLVNDNKQQYSKPLHLHFILRRSPFGNDEFVIDEPLYSFLCEVITTLNLGIDLKQKYHNVASPDLFVPVNKLNE